MDRQTVTDPSTKHADRGVWKVRALVMAPAALTVADSAWDIAHGVSGGRLAWNVGALAVSVMWIAWVLTTGRVDTPGPANERRGLGLRD